MQSHSLTVFATCSAAKQKYLLCHRHHYLCVAFENHLCGAKADDIM